MAKKQRTRKLKKLRQLSKQLKNEVTLLRKRFHGNQDVCEIGYAEYLIDCALFRLERDQVER